MNPTRLYVNRFLERVLFTSFFACNHQLRTARWLLGMHLVVEIDGTGQCKIKGIILGWLKNE